MSGRRPRRCSPDCSSLLYGHCSEFNLQWESISVWRPEIKHKVDCSAQAIFSIIKWAKNVRSNWVVFLSISIQRNENSFATFCHRLCWSSAAAGTISRNAISPPGPPAFSFTQSLSDLCCQKRQQRGSAPSQGNLTRAFVNRPHSWIGPRIVDRSLLNEKKGDPQSMYLFCIS